MTNQGQLLRCPVDDIRISGRKTQGVRVFRLEPEEHIVSLAVLPWQEGEEGDEEIQE
jgi:DNA gyrase subunit A